MMIPVHERIEKCADGQAIRDMDSLEFLEFIGKLEKEFRVNIPDNIATQIRSFDDAAVVVGAE